MLGTLNLISGALSAVHLATMAGHERDSLVRVLAAERRLARTQYEAIKRARRYRQAGRAQEAEMARTLAVKAGEKRAPLVTQIRAAAAHLVALDAALTAATAKLSAAALEKKE